MQNSLAPLPAIQCLKYFYYEEFNALRIAQHPQWAKTLEKAVIVSIVIARQAHCNLPFLTSARLNAAPLPVAQALAQAQAQHNKYCTRTAHALAHALAHAQALAQARENLHSLESIIGPASGAIERLQVLMYLLSWGGLAAQVSYHENSIT